MRLQGSLFRRRDRARTVTRSSPPETPPDVSVPVAPPPRFQFLPRNVPTTFPNLLTPLNPPSPEGRIAWAMAKRSLENAGIDRARYLPLLTFVAQGSDLREIFPFPKPIAPRGYVTVEEPIALAQLQLEYNLLDFSRGPKLEGSEALELASTLRLGRVHQTIAYNTAAQYYKTQQAIGPARSGQDDSSNRRYIARERTGPVRQWPHNASRPPECTGRRRRSPL